MALSESRRKKLEMLTRSLAKGDIRRAQEVLRRTDGDGAATPSCAEAAPGQAAGTPGRSRQRPAPAAVRAQRATDKFVSCRPAARLAVIPDGPYTLLRPRLGTMTRASCP